MKIGTHVLAWAERYRAQYAPPSQPAPAPAGGSLGGPAVAVTLP